MRGKVQIISLLVFAGLASGLFLTGCSAESIFTLPQKVTIEKKDSEATASSSSASSASSAAETAEETTAASGSSAESTGADATSTSSSSQDPQPEVLVPVGIVPADPDALTEATKKDVVEAANHRLDTGFYSRDSLIAGLISDGFSEEEAIYGADNCYVSWGVPGWYDIPPEARTEEAQTEEAQTGG